MLLSAARCTNADRDARLELRHRYLPEDLISHRLSLPATGDRWFESISLQRESLRANLTSSSQDAKNSNGLAVNSMT